MNILEFRIRSSQRGGSEEEKGQEKEERRGDKMETKNSREELEVWESEVYEEVK